MLTHGLKLLATPLGLPLILVMFTWLVPDIEAAKVRIKDIVVFQDNQEVELLGYGLIVGLDGSGDSKNTQFTNRSLANMMQRLGLTIDAKKMKVKNVAAVIVTAKLSSQQPTGSFFDITVSSVGDASSLQGGTLLRTQLSGPEGIVRAVAQGAVSIGGFNVQVDDGNKIVNNYTLVGRVPGGAKVVAAIEGTRNNKNELFLSLYNPDITTSYRIAERINIKYGTTAYPVNGGTVRIMIPDSLSYPGTRAKFVSDIGLLRVVPDNIARVVINEKTGTIVTGQHVTIEPVAIAHGTITVNIHSKPIISQPSPFSDGETIFTQEPTITVVPERARVVLLESTVHLSDVAAALNKMGVTPRDIIAIFQALKQAGALRADLVIL